MARAKRTERAAARRRYRAAMESEIDEAGAEGEAVEDATPRRTAAPARSTGEAVRLGIGGALRASFHPLHVREDIAALPSLVRHRSLWLPILVTIVSTVAVVATGGKDVITPFLFAYFVQTPALGGVFLAGFLAPRASWLLGGIVGLVAAIGYVAVLSLVPGAISPTAPGNAKLEEIALSAFLLSPIMGGLFAALAAWYRRFLTLTNPNRGRRPPNQPAKRVGNGRNRSTTTKTGTKAPARR